MSRNRIVLFTLAAASLSSSLWAQGSPDLKTAVDKSLAAMGAQNVKTLVISGEGWDSCVGQQYSPYSSNWRKLANKDYVRSVDLDARGWRLQRVRSEGENPGRGGCNAGPYPTQTQNQVTMAGPMAAWATQLEYIMLPEGFLRVALEKNATVKEESVKGKKYTVLTFTGDNKAPVSGYINGMGYVEKVQTMLSNDVLGDVTWDVVYSDWKDFGGFKFPTHILQHQGPPAYFELTVSDVKVNAPVDLTLPAGRGGRGGGAGGAGRGGAATPMTEDLGGGFWLVKGGYGAVVADFRDYIVAIEGPQNVMRSEQIIAEARRLVPNKPIKYVINTHSHYDHSGGLRAFIAEGATIVTQKENKAFYEKVLRSPRTLVPDKMSQMNPQPKLKIETVDDRKIMSDGQHEIAIYRLHDSTHAIGTLIVYLPKQKILVEADEFNVPNTAPAGAPAAADINPYHTNLVANIERLKLDVDRIIPIHLPTDDRKVSITELYTAAGKQKP